MVKKDCALYKMLKGDQEELDEQRVEIRMDEIRRAFEDEYSKVLKESNEAKKNVNAYQRIAFDLDEDIAEFDVGDFVEAKEYITTEYDVQLNKIAKVYEEWFGEKIIYQK